MRHLFYGISLDQKVPIVNERSEILGALLVRIEPVVGRLLLKSIKHPKLCACGQTHRKESCMVILYSVIFFKGDESSECDKHLLPNVAWITGKNEVALMPIYGSISSKLFSLEVQ